MKNVFKLEINLFLLILKLNILFNNDQQKVEQFLYDTLRHTQNKPGFIGEWMQSRYKKIHMSKETQVILLKHAGHTYNTIQRITGKSPNTIKSLLDSYSINYNVDEETEKELEYMLQKWDQVQERLSHLGMSLL